MVMVNIGLWMKHSFLQRVNKLGEVGWFALRGVISWHKAWYSPVQWRTWRWIPQHSLWNPYVCVCVIEKGEFERLEVRGCVGQTQRIRTSDHIRDQVTRRVEPG